LSLSSPYAIDGRRFPHRDAFHDYAPRTPQPGVQPLWNISPPYPLTVFTTELPRVSITFICIRPWGPGRKGRVTSVRMDSNASSSIVPFRFRAILSQESFRFGNSAWQMQKLLPS